MLKQLNSNPIGEDYIQVADEGDEEENDSEELSPGFVQEGTEH